MLLERISEMDNVSNKNQSYTSTQVSVLGSFPADNVRTIDNDTLTNINTQPRNMQGEHWLTIAKFRQKNLQILLFVKSTVFSSITSR